MFRGTLLHFGIIGVVAVGGGGWYYTDRALNYVEVEARIDAVDSTCHLERTKRGVVTKTREWTRDGDCDTVAAIKAETPDYADMAIERKTVVKVRYTSPADGQIHSSSYRVTTSGNPDPKLVEGGVVHVMASKTRPESIQKM